MHSHCFAQYTRFHYACPVCAKSLGDMSVYFRMLDSLLARDAAELPPAYAARRQARPRRRATQTAARERGWRAGRAPGLRSGALPVP
jgi:hypothetical protein